MSIFQQEEITCPHCSQTSQRKIARSIHAPRVPAIRQEILDDRFQRFVCDACAKPFVVDLPFSYLDFETHHFFGVFPRAAERSWAAFERQLGESFRSTICELAPPLIRNQADRFTVRALFGLEALREKLVCFDAGLSDVHLEVLKLDLMRSHPELSLHPSRRPSLVRVDPEHLFFRVQTMGGELGELRVGREQMEPIAGEAWERAREAVFGPAYVDVGRVLLAGEA